MTEVSIHRENLICCDLDEMINNVCISCLHGTIRSCIGVFKQGKHMLSLSRQETEQQQRTRRERRRVLHVSVLLTGELSEPCHFSLSCHM